MILIRWHVAVRGAWWVRLCRFFSRVWKCLEMSLALSFHQDQRAPAEVTMSRAGRASGWRRTIKTCASSGNGRSDYTAKCIVVGSNQAATPSAYREDEGYVSLCPELDIASQGSSIEEARANLVEALSLFFKTADASEIARRFRSGGTLSGIIRQSELPRAHFEAE